MPEISINNGNFLWMTRGKRWEFRLLSKCSSLSPAVEFVYKTVFLRDEGRFGYWKGVVTVEGVQKRYVACRCYEETIQRDEAGRRIPHEFLLLCSDEEFGLLNGVAWASAIMEQVRELYAERYPLHANEVTDCPIDFRVSLDSAGKVTEPCISLDIAVPKPHERPSPARKKSPAIPWVLLLLACLGGSYYFCTQKPSTQSEPSTKERDSVLGTANMEVAETNALEMANVEVTETNALEEEVTTP